MRLSLPFNTLINLPRPLFLILPFRYRNSNRSLAVKFPSSSLLRIYRVSPAPCCCYLFSTKAMPTVGGDDEESIHSLELKENIDLNEKEQKIFDRLLGTLRYCNLDTQLRVAGGWLLGKDSDDIDIAIDNMSGSEFLDKFKEYLSSREEAVQGDTIIERNPDQSKHLETARLRIYDQWIDFVNLRSEEYTEDSRIPTMKFGTAKEDAYRRDLTINSLFYNLNSGSLEDLTERGIDDLKSGKIVTPLPAKATFLDDPLRVLRAIRFGARFGFTLDDDLKEVASSEEVRVALGEKISRERIGNEIDLMISMNGPVSAVTYLSKLKLFRVVFAFPSSVESVPSQNCVSLCQAYLEAMWSLIQTPGLGNFSGEQIRLALYAALFLPFRKTVYKDNKGKLVPVVNHIFKFSMKRKTSDAEIKKEPDLTLGKSEPSPVTLDCYQYTSYHGEIPIFGSFPSVKKDVELDKLDWATDILEHWKSISLNDPEVPETSKIRVLTGFLLRDIKEFWRVALLTSLLLSTLDGVDEDQEIGHLDFQLEKTRETYLTIEDTIHELGLVNDREIMQCEASSVDEDQEIWNVKPLVNGREIMQIAELSGGSLIREWQQKLLTWQLAYPDGTAEECKDWMREIKAKRQRTQ